MSSGNNKHISSSDRFPLKPTGGKAHKVLQQWKVCVCVNTSGAETILEFLESRGMDTQHFRRCVRIPIERQGTRKAASFVLSSQRTWGIRTILRRIPARSLPCSNQHPSDRCRDVVWPATGKSELSIQRGKTWPSPHHQNFSWISMGK